MTFGRYLSSVFLTDQKNHAQEGYDIEHPAPVIAAAARDLDRFLHKRGAQKISQDGHRK